MKTNYYFDIDGVLANFHEHVDGWKYSGNYKFIRNLRPFIENVNMVNDMVNKGENVFIITLVRNEIAYKARLEWINEYMPNLKSENIIILIGNAKKVDFMKTKNGILVDDKLQNVKQWRKAGHQAIYVEYKGVIDMNAIQ